MWWSGDNPGTLRSRYAPIIAGTRNPRAILQSVNAIAWASRRGAADTGFSARRAGLVAQEPVDAFLMNRPCQPQTHRL